MTTFDHTTPPESHPVILRLFAGLLGAQIDKHAMGDAINIVLTRDQAYVVAQALFDHADALERGGVIGDDLLAGRVRLRYRGSRDLRRTGKKDL